MSSNVPELKDTVVSGYHSDSTDSMSDIPSIEILMQQGYQLLPKDYFKNFNVRVNKQGNIYCVDHMGRISNSLKSIRSYHARQYANFIPLEIKVKYLRDIFPEAVDQWKALHQKPN